MTIRNTSKSSYEGTIDDWDISGWEREANEGSEEEQANTPAKKDNIRSTQWKSNHREVSKSGDQQTQNRKRPTKGARFREQANQQREKLNYLDNLPRLLRAFGGLTLLAAVTIYLFQGSSQTDNELLRYFLLLGHTVFLTVLGFFSGKTLSDSKGARTLVALALASVPANFAILGGFIRSQFLDLDSVNTVIPTALTWTSDSLSGAFLSTAAALAFLMPVVFVGFLVLCRPLAKVFSVLFLLSNVAMLIPIRSPLFIAILVAVVGCLLVRQTYMSRQKSTHLATFEGGVAQLILLSPLAVIVGRSLWIYGVDSMLTITVSGLILGFMRFAQQGATWEMVTRLLEPARLILSAIFVMTVGDLIANDLLGNAAIIVPFSGFIFVGLMWDLSRTADHEPFRHCYVQLGVWSWAVLMGLTLLADQGALTATLAAVVGIIMLVYAVTIESRLAKLGGIVLLISGLICQLSNLMLIFSLGGWGSLALLGVIAILGSSLIEKQGGHLQWLFAKSKVDR